MPRGRLLTFIFQFSNTAQDYTPLSFNLNSFMTGRAFYGMFRYIGLKDFLAVWTCYSHQLLLMSRASHTTCYSFKII